MKGPKPRARSVVSFEYREGKRSEGEGMVDNTV